MAREACSAAEPPLVGMSTLHNSDAVQSQTRTMDDEQQQQGEEVPRAGDVGLRSRPQRLLADPPRLAARLWLSSRAAWP